MLSLQPEIQSNQPVNLMQPFPQPYEALHKILSDLANSVSRYSSLKVWMNNGLAMKQKKLCKSKGDYCIKQ